MEIYLSIKIDKIKTLFSTYSITIPFASIAKVEVEVEVEEAAEVAAVELYKVGDEAMAVVLVVFLEVVIEVVLVVDLAKAVDACQLLFGLVFHPLFGLAEALSHTVIGKSKLLKNFLKLFKCHSLGKT